jgi:hypothetical protein
MGIFKDIKGLTDMAHAAPGLIAQTGQLAEAAQANGAAQQAAGAQYLNQAPSMAPPSADGTEAIAGVDLVLYVTISRSFAEVGYDQARGPELAARHGVGAAQWQMAMDGWNARIASDPAVASAFNTLYTGR